MRKVLGIYTNPESHWVGDGFPVRSMFSHATHGQHVSPFLLLDYAGPADFAPAERPRGVGEQYVGWGVINALIALIGRQGASRQRSAAPSDAAAQKRTLSRLLWVNTGLDVLYVLGGWRAMRGRGSADARWRGRGLGIVLQGGFLFFFDLLNALALRRVSG